MKQGCAKRKCRMASISIAPRYGACGFGVRSTLCANSDRGRTTTAYAFRSNALGNRAAFAGAARRRSLPRIDMAHCDKIDRERAPWVVSLAVTTSLLGTVE